jgi:hypothetical protein
MNVGPPEHGTRSRYGVPHNCRCADCKEASARYNRQWRYEMQGNPKPDLNHGRISTYANHGCRCPDCRQAMSDYQKRRTQRRRMSQPSPQETQP